MARANSTPPMLDADYAPALTPEAEETQLIALARKRTRQRIIDGTASSQELVYYLKLGSEKEQNENEKLREEIKLLKAKTEAVESSQKVEELYANAISAFKEYHGDSDDQENL